MNLPSVPEVTLRQACDLQMGLTQVKRRRRRISFGSWLGRVLKHVLMCMTNHDLRPSEPSNNPADVDFNTTPSNDQDQPDPGPLCQHECSEPLPEISASTSEHVFMASPYNVITHEVQLETPPVEQPAVTYTVTAYPHVAYLAHSRSRRTACLLPRSHSTSEMRPEKSNSLTQSASLMDMFLRDFEHFTPDITLGGEKETYRLQCFRAGRYQCTVTGLVFHMDGEGDVRYGIIPWDMSLLTQHHKKPAGPLFDIQCDKPSVRQLHLPHCEIPSMGGCCYLSVAHIRAEGIELISPQEITDTHVIANVMGFSAFGLMRSEDAPRLPIQALVLVFLIPEPQSVLNVLLVPENTVVDEIIRIRRRRNPSEGFVNTISECILVPQQQYTLTTTLGDLLRIQPNRATFYDGPRKNCMNSFQVLGMDMDMDTIHLTLRELDHPNDHVWYAEIPLRLPIHRRPGSAVEDLKNVWSGFVKRVSSPVLDTLVDHLFEEGFINASERDEMYKKPTRERKARAVIRRVINIGSSACIRFITLLREEDPHVSDTLGLL
uniref:uncharacterized protein LOC131108888 n=1 Tax=Doryrhamphus excisus TaxID=161450 RepID=UPI0025ADE73A|nr:uncharacterized protein LOC131108888 [Doryrhamphus excisus]